MEEFDPVIASEALKQARRNLILLGKVPEAWQEKALFAAGENLARRTGRRTAAA
jgi:hypothetical protein